MNLTSSIIFRIKEADLNNSIRECFADVAKAYLDEVGLMESQVENITTKTNPQAAFAKFVFLGALKSHLEYDGEYLRRAFELYTKAHSEWSANEVSFLFQSDGNVNLEYKKTFIRMLKPAVGIFLLSLHVSGVINLPVAFNWPTNRTEDSTAHRVILRVVQNSEVLSLFASLSRTMTANKRNPFEHILHEEKKFDWFRTYGMKLVLAAGWRRPEDVSLIDLQQVGQSISVRGIGQQVAQVLIYAFGNRCSVSSEHLRHIGRRGKPQPQIISKLLGLETSEEIFDLLCGTKQIAFARPDQILDAEKDLCIGPSIQNWINIQNAFLKYSKYENSKGPKASLAIFNLYMFFYLPKWFEENPTTAIKFPDSPNKLTGSIFVSRVGSPRVPMPRTLLEFANARAENAELADSTQYSRTKTIETFFDFIIDRADEFPEAANFKQPFGKKDHVSQTSALGTNKRPIPRRLYSALVDVTDAVLEYFYYISDRVVNAECQESDDALLGTYIEKTDWGFYDTFLLAERVGYIPVIFHKNITIPIRYVHPSLNSEWMRLKNGQTRYVPRPHAMAQIATAEYSGLRHNHIQWLDESTFDSKVGDALSDYCNLIVNTDKAKGRAWDPVVNYRVIEILRAQRKWRESIAETGFHCELKYNNNPDSKYPAFRPLFSYSKDGRPHSDSTYSAAWKDLLRTFSALLSQLSPRDHVDVSKLFQLRPRGVMYNDLKAEEKLKKFASETRFCALIVQTDITPHSTRSAFVSKLVPYIPAELVGKKYTGQSEATVRHYFVPDPDDIQALEKSQKIAIQERAIMKQFSSEAYKGGNAAYIRADSVNSSLAKSMRTDVEESLIRYGCISLMVVEDGPVGIDILKREGIESAAFNKTEICPHDNICPPSIIAMLRGVRKCAVCPAAVRSIDHLPAVCAKRKQMQERVSECEREIEANEVFNKMTEDELTIFEDSRHELYEELAAWTIVEGCLEYVRRNYLKGASERTWLVAEPEILQKKLLQTEIRTNSAEYLLTRLQECLAYPSMQSPILSRQLDLLRRRLLAQSGNINAAFSLKIPVDAAAECAGVLRTLASSHGLTAEQVFDLINADDHLVLSDSELPLSIAYEEIIGT